MRRRRGNTSIAANPVLIGAATTLVVIVAVFLAYNANSGLPFIPTYDVRVEVPNASGLVKGNDVRMGGTRVGSVNKITPVAHPDGTITGVLDLKLEKLVEPLPTDSTVIVRPRSAVGLKYVQLTKGTGSTELKNGGSLPISQAKPIPVELDEFFDMFDEETRRGAQGSLQAFGDAFAGRGIDINYAIQELNPFVDKAVPVFRNLASRRTDLKGFFDGLAQAAAASAPVAEQQAELFRNLDVTFGAFARVAYPYIQESISEGPETLDVATESLPKVETLLDNASTLFTAFQPGIDALAGAAPDLADLTRQGTPVLKGAPAFNQRIASLSRSLASFSTDPMTKLGVKDLTSTAQILEPTIAYVTPAQTVCNYFAIWFRNVASLFEEGGTNGQVLRFSVITPPGSIPNQNAPNGEGYPSSGIANGPSSAGNDPTNYLHSNPYPFTAAPGQPRTCEAANEKFLAGRAVVGNVPGQAPTTLHDDTTP
jgi:virulence factor Mce-like protein